MLRHGEAVPHDSRSDDAARELTPRGEQQSRVAGRAMARLSIELAACYTSPKVRARDTARLACAELGAEPQDVPGLADGFDRPLLQDLLHAHDRGACVLVVGHNPDLEQVVRDLTGARVDFKKGGLAAVRLDGARAELIVLMRPVELVALAA
jgi:phosphohistidine phosphatase